MKKSELLHALQSEIRRHSFDRFDNLNIATGLRFRRRAQHLQIGWARTRSAPREISSPTQSWGYNPPHLEAACKTPSP